MDTINPVAAQAAQTPNGTVVADMLFTQPPIGGVEHKLRRLPDEIINWLLRKAAALFLALTAGALVTILWPNAPWVRVAQAIIAVYRERS